MPLPTPREGETETDFVGRCMASEIMQAEYPDQKQRAAVCHGQWDERSEPVDIETREERRLYAEQEIRIVKAEGKPTRLVGLAAPFNGLSVDLGSFRERILPGAFDAVLESDGEVRADVEHQGTHLLARRSKGTRSRERRWCC